MTWYCAPVELTGKIALVTGVSSGIGAATARLFMERGARVIGTSRSAALPDGIAEHPAFRHVIADLADPDGVERMVGEVRTGGLDVLVNNAAMWAPPDERDWERLFRVNVFSSGDLVRALMPELSAGEGGRIINVGSVLSVRGSLGAPYVSSKHAILGLTRSQAIEYGPLGVTSNCILPGAVDTAMFRAGDPEGHFRRQVEARCPLGRLADPDEVAGVALFLASPQASYVNGNALTVDGGLTVGVW